MSESTIEVLVSADSPADGKSFWDASKPPPRVYHQLSLEHLSEEIRRLTECLTKAAPSDQPKRIGPRLEKAELSVEITAKGEIRLIASGSIETKGAIKLIFAFQ
jgi:hypothetical protein